MKCPKCESAMAPVEFGGIEADRCTSCGGLWFDLLEHEDLKQMEGSDAIDVGAAQKHSSRDAQARVLCPRDQFPMIPMVDRTQPHIWFESCPECHGAYFDAGEFKDLKNLTWLERLLPRRRSRPI